MPTRRLPHCLLGFILLFCISNPAVRGQTAAPAPPTVVFMTDFGVLDDSVALCKGVMYSIAPELRIVDLTHEVTPFSILDGARFLYGASPYFPAGTVFVTVIDPGVGSTRKAVVVKTKRGQYFVLPDNGLITLVQDRDGIQRDLLGADGFAGAGDGAIPEAFGIHAADHVQDAPFFLGFALRQQIQVRHFGGDEKHG